MKPLYGHSDEATAYVVADYPYGFRERTQIRYWLEHKPSKGWRFVSQTVNPKTGRWNKPKASTYSEWGGAMYLDEAGHVHWEGIGPYTKDEQILAFAIGFPKADLSVLAEVAPQKLRYLRGRLEGKFLFTINNVPQTLSEPEIAETREDIDIWEAIRMHVRAATGDVT